ncbi:MAG: PatB family C-S lyase [Sulfurimonadaceae bacterium]|jgi:cystathionine beta-lyase|nr:PatB family C-S lyase [Sulfurimonadaceae bacterium]
MKKYSFKTSSPREDSNAEKYTKRELLFNTKDVTPLWVADMDIDTPDFVLDAIKKRLEHPVIGYEEMPKKAFEAQCEWMKKHHGVSFSAEDMLYSHSVVASMSVAIEAFCEVGQKVIVQTPVYPQFFKSVTKSGRVVLQNSLKLQDDGTYTFDIEDLKSKIDSDTKLLLLSSPHNPVGRVWRQDELEQILEVCLEHNIVVFSDEIHSDLVFAPNKHIPFASLSPSARDITITAIGVGKSFNMAGFAISSVAIANKDLMARYKRVYDFWHFAQGNILSHTAFYSAYKYGDIWLDELKEHLHSNYKKLDELLKNYDFIKLTPLEGTYLAWLDCRGFGLSDKELREFFVKKCGVGLSAGTSFSKEGSGFMRLNFAISSDAMDEVLIKLKRGLDEHRLGRV